MNEDVMYICWIIFYPHVSENVKEKIINHFSHDYGIDTYGEFEVTEFLIKKSPEIYSEKSELYSVGETITTEEAYFIEFDEFQLWGNFELLIEKYENYLTGYVQYNI